MHTNGNGAYCLAVSPDECDGLYPYSRLEKLSDGSFFGELDDYQGQVILRADGASLTPIDQYKVKVLRAGTSQEAPLYFAEQCVNCRPAYTRNTIRNSRGEAVVTGFKEADIAEYWPPRFIVTMPVPAGQPDKVILDTLGKIVGEGLYREIKFEQGYFHVDGTNSSECLDYDGNRLLAFPKGTRFLHLGMDFFLVHHANGKQESIYKTSDSGQVLVLGPEDHFDSGFTNMRMYFTSNNRTGYYKFIEGGDDLYERVYPLKNNQEKKE